jgi:hypothetical protein
MEWQEENLKNQLTFIVRVMQFMQDSVSLVLHYHTAKLLTLELKSRQQSCNMGI